MLSMEMHSQSLFKKLSNIHSPILRLFTICIRLRQLKHPKAELFFFH
jgi:hypothetical protein